MPDDLWRNPPTNLILGDYEIHVWHTSLTQPHPIIQKLRQTLTADELSRAKRFHFEKDRRRFIIARGVLREILSRYTTLLPDALRFAYTDYGKPFLSQPADTDLRFNVSHSGEVALYAITQRYKLGLDVEQIRPMPDATQVAERFFSEQENKVFHSISPEHKNEAFFNCWTRKEAYIKAIGEGLSHPLDSFDVTLAPGEAAKLLAVRNAPSEQSWWLHAFTPTPGYVAALAIERAAWQLKYWQWID